VSQRGGRSEGAFSRPLVVAAAAVLCTLLWGSAVPCVRLGFSLFGIAASDTGDQFVFAGVRFVLAGGCVVAANALATRSSPLPDRQHLRDAAALSCFQTSGQYLLYYVGLAHATGVSGSIVQGVSVFVALLVAALAFRMERITAPKLLGCAIGFAGVALADVGGASTGGGFTFMGEGLVMLSSVCSAISAVLVRRLTTSHGTNAVVLSGWQFVIGGATLVVVGLALGGSFSMDTWPQAGLLAWIVMVSAVAYSLWGVLLSHNDVSRVTVYSFLVPVFGVLLSLAILGDEGHPVTALTFVSLALVALGIVIVNKAPKER
jgi:drug/metabolite transporter (DMT)-like permease